MKRILLIVSIFALLALAYGIGYYRAGYQAGVRQMNEDLEHWEQLAKLDRVFLTNIVTRSNALTTGTFVLETSFPGKPPWTEVLSLTFSNGVFALPKPVQPQRAGMAETLVQNGNVVSWLDEGILYEANAEWVGLIDGNKIWGRVYGWNAGQESIGFWRIYPAPASSAANDAVEPSSPTGAGR